jgi:translocation and assembly module TamB
MLNIRKRWWLLGTATLMLVAIGVLAVALLRGWLVDWAIETAVKASDGQLVIEKLESFDSVLSPGWTPEGYTLGRLQWHAKDGKHFEFVNSRFQLRLSALWQRELHLFELRVKRVNIKTPPSDQDIVLPESLALPFSLTIDSVAIDSMMLDIGRNPTQELRGLRFGLEYRAGSLSLTRMGLTMDQGTLEGRLKLADQQPYDADGEFRLFGKAAALPDPILVTVKAKGPLKGLRIEGASTVRENPLEFTTQLDLLANRSNPKLAWSIARLMPRRFIDQIPDYQFAAQGILSFVPTVATSVSLRNLDPGMADAGKLPLLDARADLKLENNRLVMTNLSAGLAGRGLISGMGHVDLDMGPNPGERWREHVVLDLRLNNLVPGALYQGLTPADLSGVVRFDRKGLWLDLRDRGPLVASGLVARGLLNWDNQRLTLEKGELGALDGQLLATATVGLAKPHEFAIKGDARRFELHRWISWQPIAGRPVLEGSLNGAILANGHLEGGLESNIDVKLRNSTLNGLAFNGSVSGKIKASQQISDLDARLSLGASRLTAKGAYGNADDKLELRLQSDSLAQFDPRLAGRVDLNAELRGLWPAASLKLQWTGSGWQWRATEGSALASIGTSKGSAEWTGTAELPLNLQVTASNVRADNYELQQLTASVRGSSANHQFNVSGSGSGQTLRSSGTGELIQRDGEGLAWAGRLNALDSSGRVSFSVAQPVQLAVSPKRVQIDGLDAQVFSGRIKLDRVLLAEGKMQSRGEFSSILLDDLIATAQRFSGASAAVASAPNTAAGAVARPTSRTALRAAPGSAVAVRASGRFDLSGSRVDDLTGNFGLEARSEPIEGFSRANLKLDQGRLSGTLNMQLPSIAWARRFVGSEWQFDGKVGFDGEVDGTIRAPKLRGAITGSGLRLEQQLLGWRFGDGILKGQFTGDELKIEELRLNSLNGYVLLRGALQLPSDVLAGQRASSADFGTARFTLNAERLPLSIGPGQRFVLSGDTLITLNRATMIWSGKLKAEEGLIELKDLDAPSAPADLVMVDNRPGRTVSAVADGGSPQTAPPRTDSIVVQTDLKLDLGERFRVQGNGVDARLEGVITMTGRLPGVPSANGVVQVRDGTYRTYGQELKIERGQLIFTGRLDNPTIDIVALRKYQPVEAGIALSGTALAPRSRLVSLPEVPDADKLSWLVLGVSLEDASGSSQASALQAAAMTLFGNDDSTLSGGVANALGLDVLGVRSASSTTGFSGMQGSLTEPRLPGQSGSSAVTGSAQQNVVTVGKRLSSRLFVSYEQGLRGVWNLLKVQYDISNRLSVRALTGSESAMDLLYFFSFD